MTFKKILILCTLIFTLFGCENPNDNDDNNTCLQNKNVNFVLNLNLPVYGNLNFSGESMIIRDNINFIEGIYIQRLGTLYNVLELAEPNNCLQNCDVPDELSPTSDQGIGFVYTCGNEVREYNLNGERINGQQDEFNMRVYGASFNESNNTVTIRF